MLAKCLQHDLTNSAGETLLSKSSVQVLTECALRWRLGKGFCDPNSAFQKIALLDALIQKFHARAIPLSDVEMTFLEVMKLCDYKTMRKSDTIYFATTLKTLKKAIILYIEKFANDLKAGINAASMADSTMQLAVKFLKTIVESPVWAFAITTLSPNVPPESPLYSFKNEVSNLRALDDEVVQKLLESIYNRFLAINNKLSSKEGINPIERLIALCKVCCIQHIGCQPRNQSIRSLLSLSSCYP